MLGKSNEAVSELYSSSYRLFLYVFQSFIMWFILWYSCISSDKHVLASAHTDYFKAILQACKVKFR